LRHPVQKRLATVAKESTKAAKTAATASNKRQEKRDNQKGSKKSVPGSDILVCEKVVEVAKVAQIVEVRVPVPGPLVICLLAQLCSL